MRVKYTIEHVISGRVRLIVPTLKQVHDPMLVQETICLIGGINSVRIEPIIQSIVVTYDETKLHYKQVIEFVQLSVYQYYEKSPLALDQAKKDMRNSLIKSAVSGILLLAAATRKTVRSTPDVYDYLAVISTSYTVLSHGEDKISHPDVITGIVSMLSLGSKNIIQTATLSWFVNLIEIFNDWRRGHTFVYF